MHRALQISDIVDLICRQIPSPENPTIFPDAARLARTSKIFLDSALNRVWASQMTFANILRCMPGDLWENFENKSPHEIVLTRAVTSADWARPLFYLHRVRRFKASTYRKIPSHEVLASLKSSLPGEHFFPNLRKLRWSLWEDSRSWGIFPHIRDFLTPSLESLAIMFSDYSRQYISDLPRFAVICPNLKRFRMLGRPDSLQTDCLNFSSSFVRGLRCVAKVRVLELDQLAFEHLASLTTVLRLHLTDLHLSAAPDPFISRPCDSPQFISLTELGIRPATLDAALFSIKQLHQSRLTDLRIGVDEPLTAGQLSRLYTAVAESIPHAALSSLEITPMHDLRGRTALPASPEYSAILNTALRQLFCFRNLKYVQLRTKGGFDLDNGLLMALADAWPRLETLRLNPERVSSSGTQVTLHGLRAFLCKCPSLVQLGIELNAEDFSPLFSLEFPNDDPDHHPPSILIGLDVGFSPISDPVRVADLMLTIFPRGLKYISTAYTFESAEPNERERDSVVYGDLWAKVEGLLRSSTRSSSPD